jgi:hypothetical protein
MSFMKSTLNEDNIEEGLAIGGTNAWSLSMQTNRYFSENGICSMISLEYKVKEIKRD